MSAEVDWVLEQFASVVTSIANDYTLSDGSSVTLERINREDSKILEGDIRTRTAELQQGCYVGAASGNPSREPIGFEFDNRVEPVVGVRVEGVHIDEFGHVDPDGADGVPFEELVRRLRRALQAERHYPAVGAPDTTFTTLFIENEAPQSDDFADYYRTDFDVRFRGYEELPDT
ncbi:hypothetical protein [Halobaculum sp. EA56]|uniref:hypothetical protein n=1 Tax=Halobaculum sp. EA56 TaxID=3421648 RepID=UPI003EB903A4